MLVMIFFTRTRVWDDLTNISSSLSGDWIIRGGGDFNEILKANELVEILSIIIDRVPLGSALTIAIW